jgi:hypothetical protein
MDARLHQEILESSDIDRTMRELSLDELDLVAGSARRSTADDGQGITTGEVVALVLGGLIGYHLYRALR